MKNSLGNPARGDAFFERPSEIKRIYRVLNASTNVYLAAPRRIGKTSILKKLEEYPEKGYCFVYVITESVNDQNVFFKVIFEEILKSDSIKRVQQLSEVIKNVVGGLIGKVKSVHNIEFREGQEPDYYELLVELLAHLKEEYDHLVIMIDEFPQTIQNILDRSGQQSAETFLQRNRELRLHGHLQEKVNFILTGSVSLFPMVEKVAELTSINDIRTVEVNPLQQAEAKDFLNRLMEDEAFQFKEEQLDYIIAGVRWLIPFHLQLIQQEILDVYETTGQLVDNSAIDTAFDHIVHSRNKPQFEPYFTRLRKIFKDAEYLFVLEVLTYTASFDEIGVAKLTDLGVKYEIADIHHTLNQLEGDGYLFKSGDLYRYTSPILQRWCKKHICQ